MQHEARLQPSRPSTGHLCPECRAEFWRILRHGLTLCLIGLVVLVAIPYGVIGVIWTLTHTSHLSDMEGVDLVISFLGSIVCWPVLTFSNVCMT